MGSKRINFGAMVTAVAMMALLTACEQGPQTMEAQEPTVSLSVTDANILAGETTTVMADTGNLLGREVEVNWDTSLGEIEPTAEGRMARFTSDRPGTAVITAELNVDGQVIRDRINVTVNPVE